MIRLFFSIFIILFFVQCNDEFQLHESNEVIDNEYCNCMDYIQNPYKEYGIAHNENLESFYDQTYGNNDFSTKNAIHAFNSFGFEGFGDNTIDRKLVNQEITNIEYIDLLNVRELVTDYLKAVSYTHLTLPTILRV